MPNDREDYYHLAVPFKVIADRTGTLVGHFASRGAAQAYADDLHNATGAHFQILEVIWVTSTKTLEDTARDIAS